MCYPKPGPRCSAHASKELTKMIELHRNFSSLPDQSLDNFIKISNKYTQALEEYYLTPAGLIFLEERKTSQVSVKANGETQPADKLLSYYTQLREAKLMLVKHVKENEHKNGVPKNSVSLQSANFQTGFTRTEPEMVKQITDLETYADIWLQQLPDKQIAATRWLTNYGVMETGYYFEGKTNKITKVDPKIEKNVAAADEALKIYTQPHYSVVYRGVRAAALNPQQRLNHKYGRLNNEEAQQQYVNHFAIGQPVTSHFYQPASLSPETATGFSDFNTILEYRTKKAVPVMFSSEFPQEKEMLIQRNTPYVVKQILYNIKFPDNKLYTVIQLEDI